MMSRASLLKVTGVLNICTHDDSLQCTKVIRCAKSCIDNESCQLIIANSQNVKWVCQSVK